MRVFIFRLHYPSTWLQPQGSHPIGQHMVIRPNVAKQSGGCSLKLDGNPRAADTGALLPHRKGRMV